MGTNILWHDSSKITALYDLLFTINKNLKFGTFFSAHPVCILFRFDTPNPEFSEFNEDHVCMDHQLSRHAFYHMLFSSFSLSLDLHFCKDYFLFGSSQCQSCVTIAIRVTGFALNVANFSIDHVAVWCADSEYPIHFQIFWYFEDAQGNQRFSLSPNFHVAVT